MYLICFLADKCCTIIKAAAILWNFVLEHEGEDKEDKDKVVEPDDTAVPVDRPAPLAGDNHARGVALRRKVVADFIRSSANCD